MDLKNAHTEKLVTIERNAHFITIKLLDEMLCGIENGEESCLCIMFQDWTNTSKDQEALQMVLVGDPISDIREAVHCIRQHILPAFGPDLRSRGSWYYSTLVLGLYLHGYIGLVSVV